jgi:hypothetical protein
LFFAFPISFQSGPSIDGASPQLSNVLLYFHRIRIPIDFTDRTKWLLHIQTHFSWGFLTYRLSPGRSQLISPHLDETAFRRDHSDRNRINKRTREMSVGDSHSIPPGVFPLLFRSVACTRSDRRISFCHSYGMSTTGMEWSNGPRFLRHSDVIRQ